MWSDRTWQPPKLSLAERACRKRTAVARGFKLAEHAIAMERGIKGLALYTRVIPGKPRRGADPESIEGGCALRWIPVCASLVRNDETGPEIRGASPRMTAFEYPASTSASS